MTGYRLVRLGKFDKLNDMEILTLSPTVLEWAAEQVGESLASLAEVVVKRDSDRARLMQGQLTASQATKVSKVTGVPFGLLFLQEPPELARPSIPDLRQTLNATPLGADFLEVLEDAVRKQQWFIDQLRDAGAEPLRFVGRFKGSKAVGEIAADIVKTLKLDTAVRRAAASVDAYFTAIAERAESAGCLVMKSGIVRSNTHRPLSVAEFRGFAVVDPLAPLVFINGRDAVVASVFTLVHELAHIWVGESGVSDLSSAALRGIERLCNQVAAEVLVPKDEFLSQWKSKLNGDVAAVARFFRVSQLVVARRAFDYGLISQSEYNAIANRRVPPPTSGGGSPYRSIPSRNSKRLTRALVNSALAGETMLREAASLLNVRPETVMELGRRAS